MRVAYGTFDAAALRAHLEQRIGLGFEILMVHSSVNNMKPMYTDGPLDLVRMLVSYCGPSRTLVMPAFYFGDPALGGVRPTFTLRPRFDLRRTPSQMGLATEIFRRWPGVLAPIIGIVVFWLVHILPEKIALLDGGSSRRTTVMRLCPGNPRISA